MIKRVFGSKFEELVEKEVQRRVEQRMDEFYERKLIAEQFDDINRRLVDLEENVRRLSSPIGVTYPRTTVTSPSGIDVAYTDNTTCGSTYTTAQN